MGERTLRPPSGGRAYNISRKKNTFRISDLRPLLKLTHYLRGGGVKEAEGRGAEAVFRVARGVRRLSPCFPRVSEAEGRVAEAGGGVTHPVPALAEPDCGIASAGSPCHGSEGRWRPGLAGPGEPGTESRDPDCSRARGRRRRT